MNEEISMEIDPKIKKEINEEGFEENASVLIGKKEEMPELLEKLESEGRTADLGAYIKTHKEIKLPKEEIPSELLNNIIENKRLLWFVDEKDGGEEYSYLPESIVYNFIDKDGNIGSFNLDPKKLTPTREIIEKARIENNRDREFYIKAEFYKFIDEQIKELGFDRGDRNAMHSNLIQEIQGQIYGYKNRLETKSKQEKKEKFEF